jgi:transcriptional regulator with XRE-family HTH domain
MDPMPKLSQQLRSHLRECGMSPYAIAKSSGVSQSVLSRFLAGERSPTLDTADKLAQVLGLELRSVGRKPKRPKARH